MHEDILEYVRTCPTCQREKTSRIKTKIPMKITTTPTEAFEVVEIDIVGPLPITENGCRYILTMQDNLTKWSEASPLASFSAEDVAIAFTRDFICRHGTPKILKTDQGSNFQSALMRHFAKIFKIQRMRSTAYHPQTMGSIERSHHSLAEYLKIFTEKTDWVF